MRRIISIVPHEQWQSAICARCVQPGHCCTGFNLSNDAGALTCWDDEQAAHTSIAHFEPVERWGQWTVEFGPDTGRTYSAWFWRCTKLGAGGQCSIYDSRPELCREYEPLTDRLCVMTKEKT